MRILPEPAVKIRLYCPGCGYLWDLAKQQPGTWWGKGVKPEKVAPMCWCPKCSATPPMVVEGQR